MVVAAHPLAVEAGLETLRAGGTAADAAVSVQAMLGLVEPQSSGLGGGAFMLFYDAATREITFYDGRETAPAGAAPDMFLTDTGAPMNTLDAINSGLSVGAPGAVDMLALAQGEHGRLDWASLFNAAITAAEDGFAVSARFHGLTAMVKNYGLAENAVARGYFYDVDGAPWPVGHMLANPAYAETLRAVAADPRALYEGPLADAIVEAVRAADPPGTLSAADLSGYHAREGAPLCRIYRETHTVCGAPSPSSGGLAVNMILGLLEHADFTESGPADAGNWAWFVEAQRLAYADRDRYSADEDFVDAPIDGLLSDGYLAERAALMRPDNPAAIVGPGDPWPYDAASEEARGADATKEPAGTSHFVIVDADGNVVAMTTTVESPYGSKLMAGGMILNNQLTDFSFAPIDADGDPIANAAAPGKRPRSSMAPTIVLDADGRFELASGSPGGSSIIAYTAKTLVGVLDWGLTPQQAIELPNVVARGEKVRVERAGDGGALAEALAERGFVIADPQGEDSGLHMVRRLPDGTLVGGADPRREGIVGTP